MQNESITPSSGAADDGRIPAAPAAKINADSGAPDDSDIATFIRLKPRNPRDHSAPLVDFVTGNPLSEADVAGADVAYWVQPDYPSWVYLVKNQYGKAGWMSETDFEALYEQHGEKVELIEEPTVATAPQPEPATPANTVAEVVDVGDEAVPEAVTGEGGPILPPVQGAQTSASAPEPNPEAVVKLAAPVTLEGPHYRDGDRSPFDLKSSGASYVYGFDAANNAVVVRNVFGRRRTPYRIRPPLASNEAALARLLHGKSADELKARVRGTATRTGPSTPVEAWAEMLAAFTLFPNLLEELNLDDETLDANIKLLHNSGFMKSQKADHHGVYFQIPDAAALEIEVRGQGKLAWVFVGPREPDELMRLALLVKLLNYKANRRGRDRGPSSITAPANPA